MNVLFNVGMLGVYVEPVLVMYRYFLFSITLLAELKDMSCRIHVSHLSRHVCNVGSSVRWNISHGMSCLDVFHIYLVGCDGTWGMSRQVSAVMMGAFCPSVADNLALPFFFLLHMACAYSGVVI